MTDSAQRLQHRMISVAKSSRLAPSTEPVAGSQYGSTLSSVSSRPRTLAGSPPQSVHDQNFSTIRAHSPAGESTSP
jgi:hypothetical protein